MRNKPVHWSEGMFLRPHHFQAADRYWTEAIQSSEQWDHQYNYGVRKVELSLEAIANYQIQINFCQARMKDGTLISLDPGQEPDRVDLKPAVTGLKESLADLGPAFESAEVVRVYLAVPKLKMGSANVAAVQESGSHRYVGEKQSQQDESRGGNDQDIELRVLNVRVLLSTDDLSGYELLPIAQIQRASDKEATPRLDPTYFPPMLAIDAWPPLARDNVRAIYDLIGKKIEVLSEQVINRSIGFASQEPGDLDRLFMLSRLNEAYATLRVLAFASGIHPLAAYTELCRILGQLSIFDPERRTPDIPLYDHDDLAPIFRYVKERIERLINSVRDYEYEQRFFIGQGSTQMQVTLEPKWLNSDWQWYVGVACDLPEKECRNLLMPGGLDWKLGSSKKVEKYFQDRAEGVQLLPLERPPRALPAKNWIYYQVSRQKGAWDDVVNTETLAMRLKEALIKNCKSLAGQRKLVVESDNRAAELQFALFAVPARS